MQIVETNETMTAADTEYPVTLTNIRGLTMQCRSPGVDVRFAFTTGKVATSVAPFFTLKADGEFELPRMPPGESFTGTLYLASSVAGVVVEILHWT